MRTRSCDGCRERKLSYVSLLWIVAIALLVPCTEAKRVRGSVELKGGNEWVYLTKFSYSLGSGNFTLVVNTPQVENVSQGTKFHLYLDEDWDTALEARTCHERVSYAKWSSASLRGMKHRLRHTVSQSIRPHVWYFVIADCDASLHHTKLNYFLEMYNADGTHFSHEDRTPSRVYPVLTFLFWLTLFPLAMLVRSHLRRVGGMELHPAIKHVVLGLALFMGSLILKSIDYRAFSRDGVGLKNLNVTAEIFNWMAQLVVSLELLSIAFGWSVDAILSPSRKYTTSQGFLNKLTTLIVAVHVVLILLSRQYDDTHSKYHESETVPALLLILFRILLGGVFFFGVTNMHMRESCLLQKSFVTKFALLGGTYFISIPAVVTIASTIFAPYLRHQMVVLGSLVVQMIALTSLAVLMLTRNEFTEITTISAACLPTKRL